MRALMFIALVGCGHAAPRAAPAPRPEPDDPPVEDPETTRVRELPCDWLTEGTAVYRATGEEGEDGLTPYALIRGESRASEEMVETGPQIRLEQQQVAINDDALTDYYGTPGEEPWCSGYDGCARGVYVGCDEGLAELWPADVPAPGVTGTSTVVDGFRWFDLMTSERGASWTDELAEEDEGRTGGSSTLYRMGDDHTYHVLPRAAETMVEACRRHMSAEEYEMARPYCSNASALVGLRTKRGEMTFALARIAEAGGDIPSARSYYESAAEDRPDDAAIRERLAALPDEDATQEP